mmetsp:Transcript_6920/g.16033  ORF Transcript_6920/g.16033 Transcript_6920/m.16033 type:complete len:215 (-) Transcript_6920:367-1011(-)
MEGVSDSRFPVVGIDSPALNRLIFPVKVCGINGELISNQDPVIGATCQRRRAETVVGPCRRYLLQCPGVVELSGSDRSVVVDRIQQHNQKGARPNDNLRHAHALQAPPGQGAAAFVRIRVLSHQFERQGLRCHQVIGLFRGCHNLLLELFHGLAQANQVQNVPIWPGPDHISGSAVNPVGNQVPTAIIGSTLEPRRSERRRLSADFGSLPTPRH